MLLIISINIITAILILVLGYKLGERGGQRIINRIFIINIYILIYYIYHILIKGEERIIKIITWFNDINKYIEINILIDKITIIMTSLIILISYIIMKYSNWYIPELKFKGILYIFLVSMIILVSTKEYVSIYIGWEWVGISSYILINYWYNNIYNNKAGIKAILYNKIGDIALLLLLAYIYIYYNHFSSSLLSLSYSNYIILILLSIAAMAKSAQYIMHPWLGDAMAGPTPVSALLHAATMVTAGIVLLYRSILYNNNILDILLYIGIITIIFGGLASLTQNDIKKIIAYSTCSQLGYMFFISLYNNYYINYSLYHLFTHAFFKALLFLTAGIIIHYASSEQDIRKLSLTPTSLPYHLLLFSSLSLLSLISYLLILFFFLLILFFIYSLLFLFFSSFILLILSSLIIIFLYIYIYYILSLIRELI